MTLTGPGVKRGGAGGPARVRSARVGARRGAAHRGPSRGNAGRTLIKTAVPQVRWGHRREV